jgi:hypothetical protein
MFWRLCTPSRNSLELLARWHRNNPKVAGVGCPLIGLEEASVAVEMRLVQAQLSALRPAQGRP